MSYPRAKRRVVYGEDAGCLKELRWFSQIESFFVSPRKNVNAGPSSLSYAVDGPALNDMWNGFFLQPSLSFLGGHDHACMYSC